MSDLILSGYRSAGVRQGGQEAGRSVRGALRIFDMGLSLAALFALMPIILLLALAVWLQDGGPPLYGHRRIGRHGRPFVCLKFRSMYVDAEARLQEILITDPQARQEWSANHKLKADPRITPLGDILRKSSLDELPQLFNVIRGDMNLVGPRPIVEAEIGKYGRYFKYYCAVMPGITGLWQVGGRSDVSYRRRVAMDVVYARTKSLSLDVALLIATIPAVLKRKGSY